MAKSGNTKVINFFELVESKTGEPNPVRNIDPEDFHVPVSDSQGHSDRVQFRCMKQIKAMVAEIIQTKQFPYRSDSDLYRHALVRHLHFLTELGFLGSNNIFEIEATMEIQRDDETHQAFITSLEKLEDRIKYHRLHQDEASVEHMLNKTIECIRRMPEGRWKNRYKTEIKKRFGKDI